MNPTGQQGEPSSFPTVRLTTDTEDDDAAGTFGSTWVLVTGRHEFFESPLVHGAVVKVKQRAGLRMWTDDFSNLFQILK